MTRLLRAVAAGLVLVTLIAGIPLALASTIGNPLAGWSALKVGDLSDQVVIDILAGIVYLAWAQFALATLVEFGSAIGRTPMPRRLPLVFNGQQELARTLVAAALLLGTATTTMSTPVHAFAAAPPAAVTQLAPAGAVPRADVPTTSSARTVVPHAGKAAATATTAYVVPHPGDGPDTLWDIADAMLGSGERWHDIWALNEGRTQHDGSVMTQAGLLRPGWTVLIPATAGAGAHPGGGVVTVVPGDTLTGIAETHGAAESMVWALNRGRQEPGGRTFDDPNLIHPGDQIVIPAPTPTPQHPRTATPPVHATPPHNAPQTPTNHAAGHTPTTPAQPSTTSSTSTTGGHRNQPQTSAHTRNASSSSVWQDVFEGAGGLLAAGILGGLVLRRRRQIRNLPIGRTIPSTPPHLAPVEKATISHGNAAAADERFLDLALRSLAAAAADTEDATLPDIVAARMVGDQLELRLLRPHPVPPPAPWRVDETGLRWSVSVSDDLPDIDGGEQLAPFPTLVGVGHRPNTQGPEADDEPGEKWLLDLERIGAVALTGDPQRCVDLARFIAAGLAVNAWSDHLTVTMVGFGAELIPINPQRLRHTDDLDSAADLLAAELTHATTASEHAHVDVLTGRLRDVAADSFVPHVLLVAPHVTAEQDRLAAVLDSLVDHPGRAPVAVVLAGDRPEAARTSWPLHVGANGSLAIPTLGVGLVAQQLPQEQAAGIAEMLSQATDRADRAVPASVGQRPYDEFCDVSGALLPEWTLPRGHAPSAPSRVTPSATSIVMPTSAATTSLLSADDESYLETAATTTQDLQAVAPRVPVDVASRVQAADPTLDEDLAAWRNPRCPLPRLSLLGPIELRALGTKPERMPYYTEIVAFLATRDHGAQGEQIAAAFGLKVESARTRIGIARDWLGVNPRTGQMHIPDARKSKASQARGISVYEVEDLLIDMDLFKRLYLRGQARGGDEGIADYEAALSLVSGEPFSQQRVGGYEWLLEGNRLDVIFVVAITKVAHTVADWAFERGELDRAEAAARTALLAGPYEEVPRLDVARVMEARGSKESAEKYLRDEVANRDDDGDGPEELSERTREILDRRRWLSQAVS